MHVRFFVYIVCVFLVPALIADEGMWVFNNLPKKYLKDKYGFEVTDDWASRVMKSSVRFNSGGSGSFITATGLVLTNHHVAADTLQKLSTPEHNYLRDGFLAKSHEEELKAPDLELNQLVSTLDVTDRVNAAVKPGMSAEQAVKARRAAIAEIEKESLQQTGLRSDVITLYQGGQYHLYRYKKYTDVRVVFAPEADIAFFGGDPDNFEYPRYDLDMTIMRVYEDGKPAKLEHYLRWSTTGAGEDELIFVSGNPGRTSRLFTTAALEFLRDVQVPYLLNWLQRQEIFLQGYSSKGDEQARRAKDELFYIQNSRKVYIGRMQGLQDRKLMSAKQKAEYDLRAKVTTDPKLKEYAAAWDQVLKSLEEHKKLFKRRQLLDVGRGFNSRYFTIARHLVRMADEDLKPNAERLPEYRESNRETLEQELFSTAPIYEDLEQVKLSVSLSLLVEQLGDKHALVQNALLGKDPWARAAELIEGTSLRDPQVRKLLAKGGKKAIDQSYDGMILLAKSVDTASRAIRKQHEEKVVEIERQAYAQIANAIFATKGISTYPDATFTLRLSFGQVKGYAEKGKWITPWTTLGGAFEHETAHGAKEPWKLPKSWHDAKGKLDLKLPFNFVSTADIIGGNSGSPVINKKGELVGLIFDGNIYSLTADYFYSDEISRAVSVHSAGMLEALRKVYGAEALAKELEN